MKQNTIVNSILTLTVLTAVAVSSVNASPSGQPPSGNVSPNFSSLTVQNNAELNEVKTTKISPKQGYSYVNIPSAKITQLDTWAIKNTEYFGSDLPVVVDDEMVVTKNLTIQKDLLVDGNPRFKNTQPDPPCFLGPCLFVGVEIGDDLLVAEDTKMFGNLDVEKNINAKGNITSSNGSIGRFYHVSAQNVSSGNTNYAIATCNSGDVRVSCSGTTSTPYAGIDFLGASPYSSSSCYTSTWNTSGSSATITAYAYCFSPNG